MFACSYIGRRLPVVIDPIAMFLAELAPVLRQHVRWARSTTTFGYWPLDIPHLLSAYGTWYLQRQLCGVLPDQLPDPDLHAALHSFFEERLENDDYWRSLLYAPWPSAFSETDDPTSCGERGPIMTAAAYGVGIVLDPNVGPTVTPTNNISHQDSPDHRSELDDSLPYSPQSPDYTPSSPTSTPSTDCLLTAEDVNTIGNALHQYRAQSNESRASPEVIEIVPDNEDYDSDYHDD